MGRNVWGLQNNGENSQIDTWVISLKKSNMIMNGFSKCPEQGIHQV